MEHKQGEEGVHLQMAAQQRVSEHEWRKERLIERVARHRILASKQGEKGESRPQRMSELQWDKGRGVGSIRRIVQPKAGLQSLSETKRREWGLARGAGHWCWAST